MDEIFTTQLKNILQVLEIEFVTLAIEFVTLAIEFVILAQKFVITELTG